MNNTEAHDIDFPNRNYGVTYSHEDSSEEESGVWLARLEDSPRDVIGEGYTPLEALEALACILGDCIKKSDEIRVNVAQKALDNLDSSHQIKG